MDVAQQSGEGKTSPLTEAEVPKNPVTSDSTNPTKVQEEPSTSSSPVRQEPGDQEKPPVKTDEVPPSVATSGSEETSTTESKPITKIAGGPLSGTSDLVQTGPAAGAKLGTVSTAAVETPIVAEPSPGPGATATIPITSNAPSSTSVTLTSPSTSVNLQSKVEVEPKQKSSTTVTLVSGGKVASVTSSTAGATVTLSSSSTIGMKRPPSDIVLSGSTLQSSSTGGSVDQADSDSSSGDPKRKKMKKGESETPMSTTGVSSPGPGVGQGGRAKSGKQGKSSGSKEKHVPSGSGDSTGPKPMEIDLDAGPDKSVTTAPKAGDSTTSSASTAPKVPPIKIVLQSHGSHSNSVASGSNSGDQDGSSRQTSSPSGFPYVVSTSPDNPSGSPGALDSSSPSQASNVASSQTTLVPGSTSVADTTVSAPISSEPRTEAITPPLALSSLTATAEGLGANLSASSSPTRPNSGDRSARDPSPDSGALILSLNEKETGDSEKLKDSASSTGIKEEKSNGRESKFAGFSSISGSGPASNSSGSYTDEKTEKPQRVTRSSLRTAHGGSGQTNTGTPNSPSGSPKGSPSPNQQDVTDMPSAAIKQEAVDEGSNLDHPKKRKPKTKAEAQQPVASTTPPEPVETPQSTSTTTPEVQPILNCFEMYFSIRKQIDQRRKSLFPVTPKPPQGFKDYLMNRGSYVLASNANKSRVAVPILNPPPTLTMQMKEMFIDQEKERHKLRIQHLIEKEKLVLSVEQEILRVHGRAARALSNQALPFSVCTILKDQEVYNLLTPEQEEKDRNARSRYNGRLFLSWLQDVDDKWDKIKESMLLRHHNEAESLHAVQKMDWEWKLKEVGLCEPKAVAIIDDIQVPMVHVSDDFDLLPA